MSREIKPAEPTTDDLPWYKDGLRFKCNECGNCCTGAPGFVWVNKAEIAAMATVTGEEVAEFEEKYVRKIGIRKSLVEYGNGDCVFFDGKTRKCNIYDARPRQCRTWPFWESNLRSPESWAETCEACPGSGSGKLHQIEAIEAQVAVFRL